jgi:hypothetical protein
VISTGNAYADLGLLIGTIAGSGYGLLWLSERHEHRIRREAGTYYRYNPQHASEEPVVGSSSDRLPVPFLPAVRRAGRGYGGPDIVLRTPAAFLRPYARLSQQSQLAEAQVRQHMHELAQAEVEDGVRALVRQGGAGAAAALAWHIDHVQRALSWRRLVDDWQADWSEFLDDVETGRYGAWVGVA